MKKIILILMLSLANVAMADDIDYCNAKDYEISKYIVEGNIAKIKFGDDVVGFFDTKEEYINMYDPVLISID